MDNFTLPKRRLLNFTVTVTVSAHFGDQLSDRKHWEHNVLRGCVEKYVVILENGIKYEIDISYIFSILPGLSPTTSISCLEGRHTVFETRGEIIECVRQRTCRITT